MRNRWMTGSSILFGREIWEGVSWGKSISPAGAGGRAGIFRSNRLDRRRIPGRKAGNPRPLRDCIREVAKTIAADRISDSARLNLGKEGKPAAHDRFTFPTQNMKNFLYHYNPAPTYNIKFIPNNHTIEKKYRVVFASHYHPYDITFSVLQRFCISVSRPIWYGFFDPIVVDWL